MQYKRIKRNVNGVLLLDKPIGISSNQSLQKIKWIYKAAKAGQTGTLDPLATGLLPICLGEATKFAQYLTDADKTYVATVKLGMT
ncbi:MAG: tRNA pseudouridine(55) synthase TruB, partial [Methylophilaceae bacterium]